MNIHHCQNKVRNVRHTVKKERNDVTDSDRRHNLSSLLSPVERDQESEPFVSQKVMTHTTVDIRKDNKDKRTLKN